MTKRKVEAVKTTVVGPFQRSIAVSEKKCPVCGNTFTGQKRAVYDTVACRQKANYQRNGEDYRAARLTRYHENKNVNKPK